MVAQAESASRAATAEAPLPARLAAPAWAERLAAAGGQSVQVALGDDGTVRLQATRDGDAMTVRVQFSDPELQALAGTHAGRLREVLDAHFAEPVRLALGEPAPDTAGGFGRDGASDRDGKPATPPPSTSSASRADAALDSPPHDPAPSGSGRREWVG